MSAPSNRHWFLLTMFMAFAATFVNSIQADRIRDLQKRVATLEAAKVEKP